MPVYISLLRSINVAGKNRVKMSALQALYHDLGFERVQYYLQSGNLVFFSEEKDSRILENRLRERLEQDLGLSVPVLVLDKTSLDIIVAQHPWVGDSRKDPAYFHISFLSHPPGEFDLEQISARARDGEELVIQSRAVYLYCPLGYGTSAFSNAFLEARLGVTATTRNWKTTQALVGIAESTEFCRPDPSLL